MQRPLLEEEKVAKRQKICENQTSISETQNQQIEAEMKEINNYLDNCQKTVLK